MVGPSFGTRNFAPKPLGDDPDTWIIVARAAGVPEPNNLTISEKISIIFSLPLSAFAEDHGLARG
jgi:hypothetical protein